MPSLCSPLIFDFASPPATFVSAVSPCAQPLSNSTRPHTPPAHGSTRSRKRKKPASSTHPEPTTPQGECRAANGEAGLLGPPPGPEKARQLPARCGRWPLVIIVFVRGVRGIAVVASILSDGNAGHTRRAGVASQFVCEGVLLHRMGSGSRKGPHDKAIEAMGFGL